MTTLADYFHATGTRALEEREARFRQIDTPEKVRVFQQELRAIARHAFGEYVLSQVVSDTPPRRRAAGTLESDGVVIERFLYEALPGFWVPALLYRPARRMGKCPALVLPVGHWWSGKAEPMYQRLMRMLARRGVICASFDSCGQGERIAWFNPVVRDTMTRLAAAHPAGAPQPFALQDGACHGFTAAVNVTSSHCIIGDPGYLCGVHLHALTVAAGKRLVDLLQSREDVAPDKIGACGASGGGTDTRFLAAFDDRLALAVVASILGSTRALGGGDADQSLFDTVNRGISQTDLVVCVAPKPLLIVSASADKHDTAAVASFYRPFWNAFGAPGQIESGIGEGAHGFPPGSRRIIAEFVLRHLRGETHTIPDAEHADDLPLPAERKLQVSLTGNLIADGVGKNAFDLIRERTIALARHRPAPSGPGLRAAVLATLRESEAAVQRPPANLRAVGAEMQWDAEGGVPLRAVCEGCGATRALLVHEHGAEAACASPLYGALQQAGLAIARLDVRGTGISATHESEPNSAFLMPLLMGNPASLARMVLHQGRTLTGMRTIDLLQAAAALRSTVAPPAATPAAVDLVAEGGMGFAALLAAVLAPDVFRRVVLYRTPLRWQELTSGAGRVCDFAHFLYGVLEQFDTPDLTRALPAGKLTWINPVDASGNVLPRGAATKAHRGGQVVFKFAGVDRELARLLQ